MTDTRPDERVNEANHRWKKKKVAEADVPPEDLLANPYNHRIHPRAQAKVVTSALETIGWLGAVMVNVRTGHIIDGHLRVAEAISAEEPTVPVDYYDLTETEERAAIAVYDASAGLAVIDPAALGSNVIDLDLAPPLQSMIDDLLGNNSADDLPEPDGDVPDNTLTFGYVSAGKTKVGCSADDVATLHQMWESYREENGNDIGFVRWLIEAERE